MQNIERKSIGKWISILHRQFQIYVNHEMKSYDLNSSEYIYLVNLAEKDDGVSQKYLSDKLYIDEALTTRVIRNLEKKGYVTRNKSLDDKRSYTVKLTEKGKNVQPVILDMLSRWTDILATDMNEGEIDHIINKLKLMSKHALLVTKGEINEENRETLCGIESILDQGLSES
ncbi:MarR family transcriptional regulator [Desulfosporosinus sp. FKB]|uniref:MarR family winged helix-turn-helix transcriptional regulator n=1 Tax=Desulfosporosinus sp. FKB TaxID=1969835 RepID=UPI001A9A4285|nr:MarR family transcriptional regulator [Desulfosporosinus sp. FKB]